MHLILIHLESLYFLRMISILNYRKIGVTTTCGQVYIVQAERACSEIESYIFIN